MNTKVNSIGVATINTSIMQLIQPYLSDGGLYYFLYDSDTPDNPNIGVSGTGLLAVYAKDYYKVIAFPFSSATFAYYWSGSNWKEVN